MLQNQHRKDYARSAFTLVEIMIVVLIIGILLAIAIPNFIQAREAARAKACIANLKRIDVAKQQYLMDNKTYTFTSFTIAPTATTAAPLVPLYIRSVPVCPGSGTYTTNDAVTLPTCSLGTNTVNGTNYPHVMS